jgi:hypothetical protein
MRLAAPALKHQPKVPEYQWVNFGLYLPGRCKGNPFGTGYQVWRERIFGTYALALFGGM